MDCLGLVAALHSRPRPAVILDMEALELNRREILHQAGERPIRIASKSLRVPGVLRHLLGSSTRFQGVMCYHPLEACALAELGLEDLLVAYPSVQPANVAPVCRALADGHRITLMVDAPEQVQLLQEQAARHGVTLPLCLDVDMSWSLPGLHFGVHRSPIRDEAAALHCWDAIVRSPNLTLEGVMGYEAQIAGLQDAMPGRPGRSAVIHALKQGSIQRLRQRRGRIVAALRDAGAPLRFVNGGGTGSLLSTAADPSVTEVTAGSGFFAPALFDGYRSLSLRPALLFALEVVRRPDRRRATCGGGGYVASGPAGADRLPVPIWPPGLSLEPQEGAGEVQTPVTGAVLPEIGGTVLFRHAKAGELCERFNDVLLWEQGRLEQRLPTYRGLGWHFM